MKTSAKRSEFNTVFSSLSLSTQRLLKKFMLYIDDDKDFFKFDDADALVRFLLQHHAAFQEWLIQRDSGSYSDWDGIDRRHSPAYLAQYPASSKER